MKGKDRPIAIRARLGIEGRLDRARQDELSIFETT